MAVWLWPAARNVPFSGLGDMVHVCDLNGLQDYEGANGNQTLIKIARARIVAGVQGADAVLTGSPEQFGYWLAQLGDVHNTPAIRLAGYGLPPAYQAPVVSAGAKLRRLHFSGNVYSWSASTALLPRCATWTTSNPTVKLKILGGIDPGGATSLADLRALRDIAREATVTEEQEMSFPAAMALYRPESIALDLNEVNAERQLAVPIRTVNAMMHGVPIISTLDTILLRRMARAGTAVLVPSDIPNGLEQTLNVLASKTASEIGAMAIAARSFAEREFNFADSARYQ